MTTRQWNHLCCIPSASCFKSLQRGEASVVLQWMFFNLFVFSILKGLRFCWSQARAHSTKEMSQSRAFEKIAYWKCAFATWSLLSVWALHSLAGELMNSRSRYTSESSVCASLGNVLLFSWRQQQQIGTRKSPGRIVLASLAPSASYPHAQWTIQQKLGFKNHRAHCNFLC